MFNDELNPIETLEILLNKDFIGTDNNKTRSLESVINGK